MQNACDANRNLFDSSTRLTTLTSKRLAKPSDLATTCFSPIQLAFLLALTPPDKKNVPFNTYLAAGTAQLITVNALFIAVQNHRKDDLNPSSALDGDTGLFSSNGTASALNIADHEYVSERWYRVPIHDRLLRHIRDDTLRFPPTLERSVCPNSIGSWCPSEASKLVLMGVEANCSNGSILID